jgi:uncharacterized protein (DUF952 family)
VSVFHITTRKAWRDAGGAGIYLSPSLTSEGFIHCSTSGQVVPVARRFYASQTGLVLLVLDPSRLTSVVKWESPADGVVPDGVPEGALFPHIYGPINLEAVVQVLDFEPDRNGEFRLPASMTSDDPEKQV